MGRSIWWRSRIRGDWMGRYSVQFGCCEDGDWVPACFLIRKCIYLGKYYFKWVLMRDIIIFRKQHKQFRGRDGKIITK